MFLCFSSVCFFFLTFFPHQIVFAILPCVSLVRSASYILCWRKMSNLYLLWKKIIIPPYRGRPFQAVPDQHSNVYVCVHLYRLVYVCLKIKKGEGLRFFPIGFTSWLTVSCTEGEQTTHFSVKCISDSLIIIISHKAPPRRTWVTRRDDGFTEWDKAR